MAWKVKEALGRCSFCWFSLCMTYLTYHFSDGYWFVQSFFRIFPIERIQPADEIWLVLIICLAIIMSYYHLVSLYEKNRDHYQWLYKYICKSSIGSLGPLSLFQVIHWKTVWLYMLSCQSTPSYSLLIVFKIILNLINLY